MTEADILRMESELAVKLPSEYRDLLLHFPIKFEAGTTQGPLWDNVDALIKRNRELRSERKSLGTILRPLPKNLFFIGDDGAGWQNLIDISSDPPVVNIMEYENVDRVSPALTDDSQPQTISKWFHAHLLEMRNDGIDISADKPTNADTSWGCIVGMLGFCLLAAIAISLMTAGIQHMMGK